MELPASLTTASHKEMNRGKARKGLRKDLVEGREVRQGREGSCLLVLAELVDE